MFMYYKYTLRDHIKHLEDYIGLIKSDKNIDFYKHTMIVNNLEERILRIKEYLSIPYKEKTKMSLNEILNSNIKFIGRNG